MIRGIDDFKAKVNYWLDEVLSVGCICKDDEDGIKQLQRIIDLINCDVVIETDGNREFLSDIDLNGIINILSVGGKIKKLSEVDFDE